jgi:hypothetical protein
VVKVEKDGLIVIHVEMVNVNHVADKKVKKDLNILLADQHHHNVKLQVKEKLGEKQNKN